MLISGRLNSAIRLTVRSDTHALLDLDLDGNSVYETSTTLSWIELESETDLTDSDSDGMHDSYEIDHGLNPLDAADAEIDSDGDGFSECEGDCDDFNSAINPGATEVCDGIDNNCDGTIDEGVTTAFYADADGDGFGDASDTVEDCTAPTGYVTDNTDCDDTNATIYPGAPELCDGLDNDCDGDCEALEDVATTKETLTTYFGVTPIAHASLNPKDVPVFQATLRELLNTFQLESSPGRITSNID